MFMMRALVLVAVVTVVVAAAANARAAGEPSDPVGRYHLACKYALEVRDPQSHVVGIAAYSASSTAASFSRTGPARLAARLHLQPLSAVVGYLRSSSRS